MKRRRVEGRSLTLQQLRDEPDAEPEAAPEPEPKARRRERLGPVAQSAYLRADIVRKVALLANLPIERVTALFGTYVDLAMAEQKFEGREKLLMKDTERLLKAMNAATAANVQ